MDLILIVMFIMIFALTLLFSLFSVTMQKAEWSFLAAVGWFGFGLFNVGLAWQATDEIKAMFYPLTYLYWGLGVVFFFFGIRDVLAMFNYKKQLKQEQEQFEVE